MKRVKSKFITTRLAVIMMFSLTACGDKPCKHTYDNACDTICNICSEERTTTHTPNDDDGDCTTAITCIDCGMVTTEARTAHEGGEATCLKGKLCDFCGYEYDTATLNQPKSNLFAGNSDTLKREPSESVVVLKSKTPRTNRRVHHHSRTGHQKAKILNRTMFDLGFCCEE